MLSGGWAAVGDRDTASGGVALAGGALRQGPGNQCHHLSLRLLPVPRVGKIEASDKRIATSGRCQAGWRWHPLFLQQRSVGFLVPGDGRVRLIAQGGVEPPGGMAGREAIVQLLGLRSYGHIFGAGLTEGARAEG